MKASLKALALCALLVLPACSGEQRASSIEERASRGDVHAQALLGEMYVKGSDVPHDDTLAAKWWTKAAEGGDANAQYNLGVLYEHGQGVPQSDRDAALWYGRAAQQGLAAAEYNMGVFYEHGRGAPANATLAVTWYLKAARQGSGDAQYNLGTLYARNQQFVDAYFWLSLDAKSGDHAAESLRDRAAAQLSPAQAADISRRVEGWRPQAG